MKNREAIGKCVDHKFTKADFYIHNRSPKTGKEFALSKTGYVRTVDGVYIGIDKRMDGWCITELMTGFKIGFVKKKTSIMKRMEILADPVKDSLKTDELKAQIESFDRLS